MEQNEYFEKIFSKIDDGRVDMVAFTEWAYKRVRLLEGVKFHYWDKYETTAYERDGGLLFVNVNGIYLAPHTRPSCFSYTDAETYCLNYYRTAPEFDDDKVRLHVITEAEARLVRPQMAQFDKAMLLTDRLPLQGFYWVAKGNGEYRAFCFKTGEMLPMNRDSTAGIILVGEYK